MRGGSQISPILEKAGLTDSDLSWRIITGNRFGEPTRRDWSDTVFRFAPEQPDPFAPYLVRVSLKESALDATITPPGRSLSEQLSFLADRVAALSTAGVIRVQINNSHWIEFTSPDIWKSRPTIVQLTLVTLVVFAVLIGLMSFASTMIAQHFLHLSDYTRSLLKAKQPPLLSETTGPLEARDLSAALNLVNRSQSDKIAERTRFLAAISHDLRTPATRMQLRSELITDDEIRRSLLSDLDEITTMITDAIHFLRDGVEQEKNEDILFLAFLESICDDYIDTGNNVTFEDPGPLVAKTSGTVFDPQPREFDVKGTRQITLTCQPNRLRRAVNNLIDNALKYGDWARVRVSADASTIVMRINDGGPGLTPEQMDLVFEPFYRAEGSRNRSSGGAGLGLSLAKSVIESHGGEISLFNHDRAGLEVRVTLPRTS